MTLVVGLKGKDGVILASDSRGTIGDPRNLTAINDNQEKLFHLSDYSGAITFGAAELSMQMMEIITNHVNIKNLKKVNDIELMVETFRQGACTIYREWFKQTPPKQRPPIGYIIGGIDKDEKGRVYSLVSALEFAPGYSKNGYAMGGVPQYATYLAHKLYNQNFTCEKLSTVAYFLISETATQDPKVGGPIKIASITKELGYKLYTEDELKDIIEKTNTINNKFKKLF